MAKIQNHIENTIDNLRDSAGNAHEINAAFLDGKGQKNTPRPMIYQHKQLQQNWVSLNHQRLAQLQIEIIMFKSIQTEQ